MLVMTMAGMERQDEIESIVFYPLSPSGSKILEVLEYI